MNIVPIICSYNLCFVRFVEFHCHQDVNGNNCPNVNDPKCNPTLEHFNRTRGILVIVLYGSG